MHFQDSNKLGLQRLTLTLDVFKYYTFIIYKACSFRLTLTLDVFKFLLIFSILKVESRLTLTLDVFKSGIVKAFVIFYNTININIGCI